MNVTTEVSQAIMPQSLKADDQPQREGSSFHGWRVSLVTEMKTFMLDLYTRAIYGISPKEISRRCTKIISENTGSSFLNLKKALCPYTKQVESVRKSRLRDVTSFMEKLPFIGDFACNLKCQANLEVCKWTRDLNHTLDSMGFPDDLALADAKLNKAHDRCLEAIRYDRSEELDDAIKDFTESVESSIKEYKTVIEFGVENCQKEGEQDKTTRSRLVSQKKDDDKDSQDFNVHPDIRLNQSIGTLGDNYFILFQNLPEDKRTEFMKEGTDLYNLRQQWNGLCDYIQGMDEKNLLTTFRENFDRHDDETWVPKPQRTSDEKWIPSKRKNFDRHDDETWVPKPQRTSDVMWIPSKRKNFDRHDNENWVSKPQRTSDENWTPPNVNKPRVNWIPPK